MPTSYTAVQVLRRLCTLIQEPGVLWNPIGTTTSAGVQGGTTLIDSGQAYSGADTNLLGQLYVRIDETITQAFSPAVTINEGAPFSASDTTLTVNDVTGVSVNDVLIIESERLLVTAKPGGNNLTVTRGIDGTTAAIHADGTAVTRSGPISGAISRLAANGLTVASGTLTVSPAFAGQVQTGTDYSLWKLIHPAAALRYVNRVLRSKRREVISPVTLVTDGDMETTGVTNWTDIGTVTTAEKVTTAAYVRYGTQSLHLVSGAAASGKRTASIAVIPGTSYLLAVNIITVSGTWTVALYDATNSTVLRSTTTQELRFQTILFPSEAIPSTCRQVQVRITAGATEECYVDNVILWPNARREYELPSWVEDPREFCLGYFQEDPSPYNNYAYIPENAHWVDFPYHHEFPYIDEAMAHPFRIELGQAVNHPLYLRALRPYAELSADTDTTTVDADALVLEAAWCIFDALATENVGRPEMHKAWLERRNDIGLRAFNSLWGTRELRPRGRVVGTWGNY